MASERPAALRTVGERLSRLRTALATLVLLVVMAVLMGGCLARSDSAARHAHHVPASPEATDAWNAHHVPASTNGADARHTHQVPAVTEAGDPRITHHVPAPAETADARGTHHVPAPADTADARGAHHVPAPADTAGVRIAEPVVSGSVNPTDLAWLQLMIPMDERVLPLLDLGASQGHVPAVRRLAHRLRTAYVAELARLRAALHATGLPADNPHAGHDMPGMVTAAELARLRTSEGPAFDTLFIGHLRAHLRQSRSVTRSEQVSGADPAVKALAAAIERTRTTQLSALDAVERSPS